MRIKCAALAALVIGLVVSAQASAINAQVDMFYSAVSSCQGALPSFEGGLRKRPLGIVNEGGTTAFVSCAVTTHKSIQNDVGEAIFATVFFRNTRATQATVNCTLASDQNISTSGDEVFILKSGDIAPNTINSITWLRTENPDGAPFRLPGISCALPPGVQVEQIRTNVTTDIGS